MYADDLAILAERKQKLLEALEEWKEMFKKHGLRMNLEKTEVMWVGKQREELNIRFVYLGGMDWRSEIEVRLRIVGGEWMEEERGNRNGHKNLNKV